MKKKGFISLIGIILILIILTLTMFIFENLREKHYITSKEIDSIYSKNWSRNKILLALYSEKYFKELNENILKELRMRSFQADKISFDDRIIMNKKDLHKHEKNATLTYGIVENSLENELSISSRSSIYNISSYSFAKANFMNPIFLNNKEIDSRSLKENLSKVQDAIIENYGNSFYTRKNSIAFDWNTDNLSIYKEDDDYKILGDRLEKYFKNEPLYIVMKNDNSTFFIEESEEYNIIKLKGLLYINGNLYISNNLDFEGAIVVNGKTYIDEGIDFKINGLFVTKEQDGDLDYNYDKRKVFRDATYLPGFIDFKILEIRSDN